MSQLFLVIMVSRVILLQRGRGAFIIIIFCFFVLVGKNKMPLTRQKSRDNTLFFYQTLLCYFKNIQPGAYGFNFSETSGQ